MEDAALILEVESGTLLFLSLQQNYGRQPGWSRANANIFPVSLLLLGSWQGEERRLERPTGAGRGEE